jgi:hypothetical protein
LAIAGAAEDVDGALQDAQQAGVAADGLLAVVVTAASAAAAAATTTAAAAAAAAGAGKDVRRDGRGRHGEGQGGEEGGELHSEAALGLKCFEDGVLWVVVFSSFCLVLVICMTDWDGDGCG